MYILLFLLQYGLPDLFVSTKPTSYILNSSCNIWKYILSKPFVVLTNHLAPAFKYLGLLFISLQLSALISKPNCRILDCFHQEKGKNYE